MALTADKRHQFDREEFYGDFAITLGWQQNFSRYRLSSYFLTKCGSVTVGANAANGAAAVSDIRASDLGLSTTFTGCAWLCPKYQDFIADFDLYLGWDEFIQGFWTELRVPFVHTRWNAGLGTKATAAGGDYYSFTVDGASEEQFAVADTAGPVAVVYTGSCALSSALLGNSSFGDAPRLAAGKMVNCRRTANGLGGVRLEIGYDFLRRERGSMGLALDVQFPAANKPAKNNCCCDLYIFDPKVGSQHSWKIGGILRAQYMLWDREESERIDFYFDGRVAGGFSGQSTRLLGLQANGCTLFNQYLLLKKYSVSGTTATYAGLERAANKLTARVKANSSVEAQVTLMFQYKNGGFVGALGYNFYGRNEEKLCLCCLCNSDDYYYVIKGDRPVRLEVGQTDGGFYGPADSDINQTGTLYGEGEDWSAIPSAAVTEHAITFSNCSTSSCGNGSISLCPATHPRYISNTIFGDLGYNWSDVDWKPYLGVLAKVDFGSSNTALRLWGVYLKGGICF
ncbi:TPA: hypothetical protein DIC20_00130 [Candidatus Dependentiae bacterium]|nr:MAG: hypothetical protein US03_C0012G0008 [candidate division TM6 bacterium GW2011_GWF2_36_131]KKQ02588.1 MAG: hypothetical protein US13_C0013G0010 [candidate division TM6 bacterium GW2011_GWE2_36_25]KKQ19082.1 MAG: hypothetical protein US32_C0016G0008 [candidate division TM6 bacterium GW2011_GWA2_36_9]HBR70173.1 hypothetical protein [Candidatus Dependentiae bacterium]HCU00095.1 hypothetical protein [Candidatus Dependentiae bacterium]